MQEKTARFTVEREVNLESDELTVSKIKESLSTNLKSDLPDDICTTLIEALEKKSINYHELTNVIFNRIISGTNGVINNQPSNRWKAVEDVTPPE